MNNSIYSVEVVVASVFGAIIFYAIGKTSAVGIKRVLLAFVSIGAGLFMTPPLFKIINTYSIKYMETALPDSAPIIAFFSSSLIVFIWEGIINGKFKLPFLKASNDTNKEG